MVNVTKSYKLIELLIDGKVKIIGIDPKDAWSVFEFSFNDETFVVNEGDIIEFITENGELKTGNILKIKGKKEKTKLQIVPTGMEHEETWSVLSIKEGTFKVINKQEDTDNTEDE
jgi:hypothetical protein